MPTDKSIPTTIRLSPHYREQLQRIADSQKRSLSDVARDMITNQLEDGPNQALADSITELQHELDRMRGELKRRDSVDQLRDDLWSVLGSILMEVGNWKEEQVRALIEAHRKQTKGR